VKDRGELELRFGRPWNPVVIPDEPVTVRILDVPSTGLSASFVCRFEVRCSDVRFTEAQSLVQAKIWRDVLVSSGPVRRGSPLRDAEVKPERRDVLAQRDFVPARMLDDGDLELTENLAAGVVLTGRSVRLRPAILRGTMVEAWIHDGGMQISLKVEALEDGVVGQTLRVRNPKTKRELLGKVHNEQTVILHL
jgi:flagella basal body P-ring formation protein FlgA